MLKKLVAIGVALAATAAVAAVDVNKASPAELEAVKGIGPAAAAQLLDERKKGPFKDWRDVMQRVRGIKEARAARLSEAGLTVNGQGYPGAGARKSDAKDDKPAKAAKQGAGEAALAKQ